MLRGLFLSLTFCLSLHAHSLVFDAIDNEDGTMEIIGMFSTGASAEGAILKVVSLATSEPIYEKRIPASGSLMVDIPKEPYKLILDSGPGHKIEKSGDIKPEGGFKEIVVKKINYAFYTTLTLSILFILMAFTLQAYRIKKRIAF